MAIVLAKSAISGNIPNLYRASTGTDWDLRALLIPMNAGDAFGIEIAKFGDSIIVGVPEIQAGV